jgi:hypothetical protein
VIVTVRMTAADIVGAARVQVGGLSSQPRLLQEARAQTLG